MQKNVLIGLLLTLVLLSPLTSGAVKGGEDVNPDESDVPFTINSRDSPSVDSKSWSLSITMNDDEYQNNSLRISLNYGLLKN